MKRVIPIFYLSHYFKNIIVGIEKALSIHVYCINYFGCIIHLLLKCSEQVVVCKEMSFIAKCDNQQQIFHLSDYGIKLMIPPSAVPYDIQQISIAIQVIASGPFVLPFRCQPISCFYWIQSSHKFLKPVEVHLEHHAELLSEEDCQELAFIVSPSTESSSPPYQFQFFNEINSNFPVGSSYGMIKVADFSIFSIAWKRIRAAFSDHFRYIWMVYLQTE